MVASSIKGFFEFNPSGPDHTCIAVTHRKRRCRRHIKYPVVLTLQTLLSHISQPTPTANIYDLLVSYAKGNLCQNHDHIPPKVGNPIFHWATEIDQHLSSSSRSSKPDDADAPTHPSVYDAVCSTFCLASQKCTTRQIYTTFKDQLELSIRDILYSSLEPRDFKSGVVYLHTKEELVGLVKIGTTSRRVNHRFSEWKYQCGYDPILLHLVSGVRHARRAEQLIFSELKQHRRQQAECDCGMEHTEWFECDTELAKDTIRAWSCWLTDVQPYDEDGIMQNSVKIKIENMLKNDIELTAKNLLRIFRKEMSLEDIEIENSLVSMSGEEFDNSRPRQYRVAPRQVPNAL